MRHNQSQQKIATNATENKNYLQTRATANKILENLPTLSYRRNFQSRATHCFN